MIITQTELNEGRARNRIKENKTNKKSTAQHLPRVAVSVIGGRPVPPPPTEAIGKRGLNFPSFDYFTLLTVNAITIFHLISSCDRCKHARTQNIPFPVHCVRNDNPEKIDDNQVRRLAGGSTWLLTEKSFSVFIGSFFLKNYHTNERELFSSSFLLLPNTSPPLSLSLSLSLSLLLGIGRIFLPP